MTTPDLDQINAHMVEILDRWQRWLRAGGGISASMVGSYEERHDQAHEEYRDLVAELVDYQIAQLPHKLRRVIIQRHYLNRTERDAADACHVPRSRLRTIEANAIGWLAASLYNLLRQPPTVRALERWVNP